VGVTLWFPVGAEIEKKWLLPLSGRVVLGFDQRGTVSLAFDLEDDRSFDQAVEERHRIEIGPQVNVNDSRLALHYLLIRLS
jgi:hypothetical protein